MAKPASPLPTSSTGPERAVMLGVIIPSLGETLCSEHLDELEFLAKTAGATVQKRFVQRLPAPDSRTYLGSGKIKEVEEYVRMEQIDLVLVDDELSPAQLRNLERLFNPDLLEARVKILDRSTLILDIFASRARSAQSRTQVELAQHEYLLPRLTRMWTHLSKQKGGIGMKGPGEKEIETDRRNIRYRITLLKEKLVEIERQHVTQRKNRGKIIRVALVGYTNVGKSTLMNELSKSEVLAENLLFATLDATVRKVVIDYTPFLLSDTVGFIRKLPHHLIESFKSTLDEVRESDILVHVVDASHPGHFAQMNVVQQTLHDLGVRDKPMLTVMNKIDLIPSVQEREAEWPDGREVADPHQHTNNGLVVSVSVRKRMGMDVLRAELVRMVKEAWIIRYPHQHDFY
jgi:GTP-binding protein HflX